MTTSLYTVTYKAPDGNYHRAECSFERVRSVRKLAAKLAECPRFSEVTVWAGQPGGMRASHLRSSLPSRGGAVFPHAVQGVTTGNGCVARPVNADGSAVDSYNYGGVRPIDGRVFVRQVAAEKHADKLDKLNDAPAAP